METKKGLVVTLIHSNYCYVTGGTEKFEREYSSLLQQSGYDNLAFFSLFTRVVKRQYVGAILNDHFVGIYAYEKVKPLIINVALRLNINLHSISIQHLKNHDCRYLADMISDFNVPIKIFVHDYYFLCTNTRMISSAGVPCGLNPPSNEKCLHCEYKERAIKHFAEVKDFFESIRPFINKIIVPSEFVKECFEKTFPTLIEYVFVRPHQILSGTKHLKEIDFPIKLAYVGTQIDDKGYHEWVNLIEHLKDDKRFELYYFGSGEDIRPNVNNVKVSQTVSPRRTMEDYLKEYDIACAFFWSHCAETYSYVYYELSLAGAFIVTNENSGNVTAEVQKNENGKIFKSIKDCFEWFETSLDVIGTINDYRINGAYKPNASRINDDLMVSFNSCCNVRNYRTPKSTKSIFMTVLYQIKHRR